jgi:hypothetical protein
VTDNGDVVTAVRPCHVDPRETDDRYDVQCPWKSELAGDVTTSLSHALDLARPLIAVLPQDTTADGD